MPGSYVVTDPPQPVGIIQKINYHAKRKNWLACTTHDKACDRFTKGKQEIVPALIILFIRSSVG